MRLTICPLFCCKSILKDRIIPHVFINTVFKKSAFTDGESIEGSVELTASDGSAMAGLKTLMEFKSGGRVVERIRRKSDDKGSLTFVTKETDFPGPTTLSVSVRDESHEEVHTTTVPLEKSKEIQLSFMPEGGKIISGITNYVAFKAASNDGQPAAIKEAKLLADGEEVSTMHTDHAGMGRFHFFADGSKDYRVEVLESNQKPFELPEFSEKGVQLHLKEKDQQRLVFSIVKSHSLDQDSIRLAVKQRGTVFWVASALLDNNGLLLNVPIEELPQGIVEVTLYNSEGATLAERLVFLHLDRQLDVRVEASKPQYGSKEMVNLKLKVTDKYGDPARAVFTLSVVDEIYASPFAEKNIASHFLLSNELRGSLFEPTYYFNKGNAKADAHLDLLMLTQGWRAYEWNYGHLIDLKEVEDFGYAGGILGQIDLKSLSRSAKRTDNLELQLFGEFGIMLVTADSLGRFLVPSEVLMASKRSVIAVKVVEDEKASITFANSFAQSDRTVDRLAYDEKRATERTKNWEEKTGAIDDIIELDVIEITAKKVTYDKYLSQPLGIGLHKATSTDYVCQYNILNCSNHRNATGSPVPGGIYLNGSGGGMVRVAYHPAESKDDGGITFVKGHYQIPTFYLPDYEKNPDERLIPDFRNTLVWKPSLVTDENGEVEISFFTSDIRSIFKGKIEGLGAYGEFGVHVFDLKVLD